MKKIVRFLLVSSILLTGCNSNTNETNSNKTASTQTTTSKTETTTQEIMSHPLEDIGMTYREALNFDEMIIATNENIEKLTVFDDSIKNNFSSLTSESLEEIKLSTNSIEVAYLNNGGQNLDSLIDFLQNSNFGFYKIATNSFENKRQFTYPEAYGCLNSLLSFVDEIGVNQGFTKEQIVTLKMHFLIKIEPNDVFTNASTNLMVDFK